MFNAGIVAPLLVNINQEEKAKPHVTVHLTTSIMWAIIKNLKLPNKQYRHVCKLDYSIQ